MASSVEPKGTDNFGPPKDTKGNKSPAKDRANNTKSNLDHWRNSLKEEGTKKKLDSAASTIFDLITQGDTSKKPDASGKQNSRWLDDIKCFLEDKVSDPGEDGQMDHCLRWYILLKAVSSRAKNGKPKKNSAVAISNMIVEKWPDLAFVTLGNLYEEESKAENEVCKEKCKNPNYHKVGDEIEEVTPFHAAARNGDHATIKTMISKAREIYDGANGDKASHLPNNKKSLLELVKTPHPETDETALMLALRAKQTSVETLAELLEVRGITEGDKCFKKALEDGRCEAVDVLLRNGQQLNATETSKFIIVELDRYGKAKGDKSERRLKIVKSLVRKATTPEAFNHEVVEKIIEMNLIEVWKEKDKNFLSDEVKDCLLHMAVLHEKFDFVELFLADYPSSLSLEKILPGKGGPEKTKDKFPLWYNNHKWNQSELQFEEKGRRDLQEGRPASQRDKIRDLVVTKMIHVLDMNELSDILHKSLEPFDEFCFDISRMNSSTYQVSEFVDSLIYQDKLNYKDQGKSLRMHRYEHTLKYVEFPPLDMMVADRETYKDSLYLKKGHDEVFRIFNWLSDKGVRKIIKLIVPDRLVNPHDDLMMAHWVEKFQVEVLDWKVLDLSISIFKDKKQEIKELHLYSSGKRAVISHWFNNDEGVKSLEKETCTEEQANILVNELRMHRENLEKQGNVDVRVPGVKAWYRAPEVADLTKIAYRLAPKLADWLVSLDKYVAERVAKGKPKHQRTKVAILDNGILSISPITPELSSRHGAIGEDMDGGTSAKTTGDKASPDGQRSNIAGSKPSSETPVKNQKYDNSNSLWSRIAAGRSFVESTSKFCQWQFPSHPHGTQMANLICAIDPLCEIYVARVAEDAFGITAKAVEKAIEWAINEKVDVISMSFALSEDNEGVLEKIKAAQKAGIVMTCSTHDEGSRIIDAYPATYKLQNKSLKSLIVLAACDEYGKLLREVKKEEYDYKLVGQDVPAGVVPFVKSEEKITGSSVATALAAGLCSLILTCDRLAHPGKEYSSKVEHTKDMVSETTRIGVVGKHLHDMQSNPEEKTQFVVVEKFGNISEPSVGQDIHLSHGRQNIKFSEVLNVLKEAFGMGGVINS